jgi:hypothetical protein
MIVSGFRSHSSADRVAVLPLITKRVAEYGAKLRVELPGQAWLAPTTILFGEA